MKHIRVVPLVLLVIWLCSAMPVVAHAEPTGWTVKQIASDVDPMGQPGVWGQAGLGATYGPRTTSLCTIRPGIDSQLTTVSETLVRDSSACPVTPSSGNRYAERRRGGSAPTCWAQAGFFGRTGGGTTACGRGGPRPWSPQVASHGQENDLSTVRILTVRPGIDSTPSIVATGIASASFGGLAISNNRLAWIDGVSGASGGTEYLVRTQEMSYDFGPWTLYQKREPPRRHLSFGRPLQLEGTLGGRPALAPDGTGA